MAAGEKRGRRERRVRETGRECRLGASQTTAMEYTHIYVVNTVAIIGRLHSVPRLSMR